MTIPERDLEASSDISTCTDYSKPEATVADWNGPDDPDNAQNWSRTKKWYHTLVVASLALVATLASSIITPGLGEITREFGASEESGVVVFAIYILGLAMGAPIAGPLSETFGRKPVYLILNTTFAFFILGSGFANSMAALALCRFFAGFFASPSLSCGNGTVSDIWSPEQRATPLLVIVTMPYLGPALGPLIGGYVSVEKGWRWTSWTVLFAFVCLGVWGIPMSETYKKTILQRRARRLGLKGPTSETDGKTWSEETQFFARTTLIRPLKMLFTEAIVLWFCLYVAYIFAMQYSFYTAFPYVFERYYSFGIEATGLTFLGLTIGHLLGAVVAFVMNKLIYKRRLREMGQSDKIADSSTSKLAPEQRLYPAMIGGPLVTMAFFLFGWTAAYSVHWIAPLIGEALFGMGNTMIFMSCTAYIMDTYGPLYGASAIAGSSMLRYLLGFLFPLFSKQMYAGMGVQWACTMLGCVSALGMCIPYLFFKLGPELRARAKFERGY